LSSHRHFAVIDIGSNSCLLLIAELRNGIVTPIFQKVAAPRLGRGLGQTGILSQAALTDLNTALADFLQVMTQKQAQLVGVAATAAFRRASNGAEALAQVTSQLSYPARILSGEEEARMSYAAVYNRHPSPELAVIDLGGGSTEIHGPGINVSMPIGAVSWNEKHGENQAALIESAKEVFQKAFATLPKLSGWPVAVGGTASALALLDLGLLAFDAETLEGHQLDKKALQHWVRIIGDLSSRERNALPGLDPGRGDILLAGACILLALVEVTGLPGIRISDRGLRFGLLLEGAKLNREPAKSGVTNSAPQSTQTTVI